MHCLFLLFITVVFLGLALEIPRTSSGDFHLLNNGAHSWKLWVASGNGDMSVDRGSFRFSGVVWGESRIIVSDAVMKQS